MGKETHPTLFLCACFVSSTTVMFKILKPNMSIKILGQGGDQRTGLGGRKSTEFGTEDSGNVGDLFFQKEKSERERRRKAAF